MRQVEPARNAASPEGVRGSSPDACENESGDNQQRRAAVAQAATSGSAGGRRAGLAYG
jgi:hypothetical protein